MPLSVPKRGEIWRVDLGYAGKVRPVVVLSIPYLDHERALHIVMAHTTSLRGTRFEIAVTNPALESGAFDAQQIFLIAPPKFERRLGQLSFDQMRQIDVAVASILALKIVP